MSTPSGIASFGFLARNTLFYGFGFAAAKSISLLLLPLYTNVFSPAEYGLITLLSVFLLCFGSIYGLGILESLARFFSLANDESERRNIFSSAALCIAASSLCFFLVSVWFSSELSLVIFGSANWGTFVVVGAGSIVLDQLVQVQLQLLRIQHRVVLYSISLIAGAAANILLNILLLVRFHQGPVGVAWAFLGSSVMTALLLFPFSYPHFRLKPHWPIIRKMYSYGAPFVPVLLAFVMIEGIDRYLLKTFAGLEVVGVYGAGYRVCYLMLFFVSAFNNSWSPIVLQTASRVNSRQFLSGTCTWFCAAAGFLFLAFILGMPRILSMQFLGFSLLGTEYGDSIIILPYIIAGYIGLGLYYIFAIGLELTGRTRPLAPIAILAAFVNLTGNLVLIPLLKDRIQDGAMIASALSTVLAYGVLALLTVVLSQKYYPIPYNWKKIGSIAAIVATGSILLYQAPAFLQFGGIVAYVALLFLFRILSWQDFRTSLSEQIESALVDS